MQTKTEYKTKMVLIWVLRVPLYGVVTIFEAHKKVCWSYKCTARRLDDRILLWAGFIIPRIIPYLFFPPASPELYRAETSLTRVKKDSNVSQLVVEFVH